MIDDLIQIRQSLLGRFAEFAHRVRAHLLIEGVARLIATAAGLAVLSFLIDHSLRLSPITRVALLVFGLAILGLETWRQVLRPMLMKLDPVDLAYALDHRTAARVATILELPNVEGASPAMIRQAVLQSDELLRGVNLTAHFDQQRRQIALIIAAMTLLISMLVLVVRPSITDLWLRRTFLASSEPWPQDTYLSVFGTDNDAMIVPRGEPFVLRVGARQGSVSPEAVNVRFRDGSGERVSANLTRFGANDFRDDFPAVTSDTEIEIRGGDDELPLMIHPVDRPRIIDLKLIAQHPTEAKPTTYDFSGEDADLAFLPKTKMELDFTANTNIAATHIKSATTQPSAGDVTRLDDRHFALHWTQAAPVRLEIELLAAGAKLTSVPTSVAIGLKTDQPPRATLAFSGVRNRITPSATIPLTTDARDDYGVAKVGLQIRADVTSPDDAKRIEHHESAVSLYGPLTPATEMELQLPYSLAIAPMKLLPGNLLNVRAVVTDDCYTGAQTSASRDVTFRIVSPEELFREILLRQQSERVKFRRQVDDAHKQVELLATLSTADSVALAGRGHRAAQREIDRITTSLAETLMEMQLNALSTPEARDLMNKNIIEPLKALNSELLNPQKDALDALRANDSGAIAAVQARQDQIVAKEEEILKQMSQWDNFVDVLNQLNEIIKLQTEVKADTEGLKKSQAEGVFDK
jgi:hypothetical protein